MTNQIFDDESFENALNVLRDTCMIDNIILREIPSDIQSITLRSGWNIMSTYIVPQAPNMIDVMSPVVGDLVVMKDGDGDVYWPTFSYNGLGDISNTEGYQLKMSGDVTLEVFGEAVSPELTPLNIESGWRLVSYLRDNPASVDALFKIGRAHV